MRNSILSTFLIVGLLLVSNSCNTKSAGMENKKSFKTAKEMVSEAKSRITEISPEEFHELLNAADYSLIDVRTQSEFNAGHIPGSISIPRGVLEFRIDNEDIWANEGMYVPEKEGLIIIYCKKGSRAALSADVLQKMGYTNVKSITGGWLKWKYNYPKEKEVSENVASGGHEEEGGC